MSINPRSKTSSAIQSLATIALTLPGIKSAKAGGGALIIRPKVSLQYARVDEGTKHYKIDVYNSLLELGLTSKSDLTIKAGWECMTGVSMIYNEPASLSNPPQGSISKIVNALTNPSGIEKRRYINVKPRYFFEDTAVGIIGDLSEENDYSSKGIGLTVESNFNNKNTQVFFSYLYEGNHLRPTPSPQVRINPLPVSKHNYFHNVSFHIRQDLTDKSYTTFNMEYLLERGYLSIPYKSCFIYGNATVFPKFKNATFNPVLPGDPNNQGYSIFPDTRPPTKNQISSMARFVQFIPYIKSSCHIGYRFVWNDWNIKSHTFTIDYYQPFLDDYQASFSYRYYTQSKAKFYAITFTASAIPAPFTSVPLKGSYASEDWRLSKYGDMTYEVSLNRKFMSNKSGKFIITGGIIDRRNKYFLGPQDKTPNPYNNFTTYYGTIGVVIEM